MMDILREIQITNLSKRFKGAWLFKDFNDQFLPGDRIAVLGPNGSGKSTFLKIISGYMGPSEGSVSWLGKQTEIDNNEWHKHYGYCAPYQELVEEFSLQEGIDFHFSLKTRRPEVDINTWMRNTQLEAHNNKLISRFSSGMKQRLKLLLTMASRSTVYFLDEPCSNLDAKGIEWFITEVTKLPEESIVIIASNSPKEYEICKRFIQINN